MLNQMTRMTDTFLRVCYFRRNSHPLFMININYFHKWQVAKWQTKDYIKSIEVILPH